jgi:two-component system capsular synthesis response regulator RcsB
MCAIVMEACAFTARGIREVLQVKAGFEGEVRVTDTLGALPAMIDQYRPQLLIIELCGTDESVMDGLSFIAQWQVHWRHRRLIVCTGLDDPNVLQLLCAAKINGIVLKQEPALALVQCIDLVQKERRSYSYKVRQRTAHTPPVDKSLSLRELEVLKSLFAGNSVTRTALDMQRDVRTVSSQKRRAMQKLGFINDGAMFIQGKWLNNINPLFSNTFSEAPGWERGF